MEKKREKIKFDTTGLALRILMAALVVFGTYNAFEFSYVSWWVSDTTIEPLKILVGLVLAAGWVVLVRATARSLSYGVLFILFILMTIYWWLWQSQWIEISLDGSITFVNILLTLVFGFGVSWSHIRKRLTGQTDVDDVDLA